MICSSCGETTTTEPCIHCGSSPLLEGKYRLDSLLGQGAVGTTYAATRLADDVVVAIKEMPLRRAETEKSRELIDREIALLRQLKHPCIPDHIDDFRFGVGKHRALYLVQEHIDGQSLAAVLETHRFSEEEVCDILASLLDILHYLHGLRPPVIHRDLKPSNVMRRPDGSMALIDFGAARDAITDPDLGGSTVAGTFGYMAPEQYQGDATPSTDLYALGMLAATLLTRTEPRELLTHGSLTAGLAAAHTSLPLQHFLSALTETEPQDRPRSAQAARLILRRLRAAPDSEGLPDESTHQSAKRARPAATKRPPRPASDLVPPSSLAPRGSRRVVIGALAFVAIAVLLWSLTTPSPPASPSLAPEPTACSGGPCKPIGEGQLKGVQLGMTLEKATEAFPELASAAPQLPMRIAPPREVMDPSFFFGEDSSRIEMPGSSLRLTTTLINQAARCSFQFAVSEQLSAMQCELLDDAPSADTHANLTTLLRDRLVAQYGPPSRTSSSESFRSDQEYRWLDETGHLTLRSEFTALMSLPPTSTLEISFESTGHEALVAVLEEQAQQQYDEAKAQKVRSADEELQRLHETLAETGGVGADL